MASLDLNPAQNHEFDYLCVDQFIRTLVQARTLATAFELGLIDYLLSTQVSSFVALKNHTKIEGQGLRLLLDLLKANNVVKDNNGKIKFSKEFNKALQFRDLLEAKLEIANFAAYDLMDSFSWLIKCPPEFINRSRIFQLFNYSNCLEATPDNYEKTKSWMRFTTLLTRYEAPICLKYHDFSPYRRLLDIGGNSGEFALQICRRHPKIHASVFDLPLVCKIGQAHILPTPEADRITFLEGNALTDNLPTGFDLIVFKSLLHDWPQKIALQFIAKGTRSLEPGGTLLIFERGPLEISSTTLPYSIIPFLLFAHSFRSPSTYLDKLEDLGYQDIAIKKVDLEMTFWLISAKKGANP